MIEVSTTSTNIAIASKMASRSVHGRFFGGAPMLAFGHWSLTFNLGGLAAGAIPPKSFDSAIFSLVCAYPFTLGG